MTRDTYWNLGNAIVLQAHEDAQLILKKIFLERRCTKSMVKDWRVIMSFLYSGWYMELCDIHPLDFVEALFRGISIPTNQDRLYRYVVMLLKQTWCSVFMNNRKKR